MNSSNLSSDDDGSTDHDASRPTNSVAGDLINVVRGFCMGAADTVPGVSGGTVALILGHYDRLVAAINRVDVTALHLASRGQLASVWSRNDLRFLLALGIGIGLGIITLAGLMHWLLIERMNETMAVFFGLVLASVWIVRRNVDAWSPSRWAALLAGVAIAVGISMLPASHSEIGLPFLFFSGAIAICAMILPGISGAFVLLLLGVYEPIIGMVKGLRHGEISFEIFGKLIVFAAGCGFGLLAFSRVLHYWLGHHRDVTMATLIGLMIGSVGRIWPLQRVTAETAELELKFQRYQWLTPADYPGNLLVLIGLTIAAAAFVLVIDAVVTQRTLANGKSLDRAAN